MEQAIREKKNRKGAKKSLIILGILLAMCCLYALITGICRHIRNNRQLESDQLWQQGKIQYKGSTYQYNDEIHTYLILGIDSDEPVQTAKDYISGGQADTIFLLIADGKAKTFRILSINRAVMAPIQIFDQEGNDLGIYEGQLCVQHGFGDGGELSCQYTVEAVQRLLWDIPIDGCVALNRGAIYQINSAIGGVELIIDQDIPQWQWTVGQIANFTDEEAYIWLSWRDTESETGATDRMNRQILYLKACLNKFQQSNHKISMAWSVYRSIREYLYTQADLPRLAWEALTYDFDLEEMYGLPGTEVEGERFMEFYMNEEETKDLIFQLFYTEEIK